jgi:hypothetical protein
LLLRIPIVTSNTKIGTLNTNCYFKYQVLLEIPAAARGSNSLGDTAPASAVAQDETKTTRPMARNTSEQDGPALKAKIFSQPHQLQIIETIV